jgi:hypothetical protein
MPSPNRRLLLLLSLFTLLPSLFSSPLSRSLPIDFFRDVPSRNLKGLATRADGRLVAGPVLTDLNGPAIADILWTLEAAPAGRWLVGTGPDGKIFELTLDLEKETYTARELIDIDDTHVFALRRLPDGSLLAGTSPHGTLALIRDGKVTASLTLPADSLYDLQLSADAKTAYVATGNPAKIFAVDLAAFSASGLTTDKLTDPARLAEKGLRLLADIKDRNVRRLALVGDTLIAGTSPKGNIYTLPITGGDPLILQENRDAEVAALLPQPDGDFYAALVFSNQQAEARLNRPPTRTSGTANETPAASPAPANPPPPINHPHRRPTQIRRRPPAPRRHPTSHRHRPSPISHPSPDAAPSFTFLKTASQRPSSAATVWPSTPSRGAATRCS